MGLIQNAFLYFRRRHVQTILIVALLALIVFGECIGLLLYGTSVRAEQDAFVYNGTSLYFEGENLELTREDYEQIEKLDYVLGVDLWSEIRVTPLDTENVKDHTGADPTDGEADERKVGDDMVLLAQMDIPMMDTFRWESSVSLVDGEYADYENKGIMVESRYASQNHLSVGDAVTFYAEETETTQSLTICGIYQVDSDFVITDANTEGASVYIHSPYNTIYMDYYAAGELMGLNTSGAGTGGDVYVDELSHLQEVTDELYVLLGENMVVYDNTSDYLEDECSIVGLMRRMAQMVCVLVFTLGFLMVLLVFSLFSRQYQEETGRFLILGNSGGWCFARFAWITLFYVIAGVLFGIFLYMIGGNLIVSVIGDVSANVISDSYWIAGGGYETPNFKQGFAVTVSIDTLLNGTYLVILAGVMAAGWAVTLLMPLHSVFIGRPREVLHG